MAQFDVYRVAGELILDCQSDILDELPTRFTVPLEPVATAPHGVSRLNPAIEFGGEQVMMLTEYAGAVPKRVLQDRVGSLATSYYEIRNALDVLVNGV